MTSQTNEHLFQLIQNQKRAGLFKDVYGLVTSQHPSLNRISRLVESCDFEATHLFSAPGRTELGGNHTDHNFGKVLCAAVRKDTLAAVAVRDDDQVVIRSEGFDEQFQVDISDLNPRSDESGTSNALIRGVLAGIKDSGGKLGGFTATLTSNVGVGSGLSSSASFEVLIGTIINSLFNDDKISPEKIAQIGQFAENTFFGKPCGLMDQTASSVGGIIKIDFEDPDALSIHKVDFNLQSRDYTLLVVNSGGNHADLTPAYASIPQEMKLIAQELGATHLRMVDENRFLDQIASLRAKLGDRAVLRGMHFFNENKRVDQMVAALELNDFDAYLKTVEASGLSSQNILQNAIPPQSDGQDQGLSFALGVSQLFIEHKGRGVARVHGGGFAGTIQVYIHNEDIEEYSAIMGACFNVEAIENLYIRLHGACEILRLK